MTDQFSDNNIIRLEDYCKRKGLQNQGILLEVHGEMITTNHYLESKNIGDESIQELNEVKTMSPDSFFFNALAIQLTIIYIWFLTLLSAILLEKIHTSKTIFFSLLFVFIAIVLFSYAIARLLITYDNRQ